MQYRSILVTGGAGFIASHFVKFLLQNYDSNVIVIDRIDKCASLNNLPEESSDFHFYKGDIMDTSLIKEVLTKHKIDLICHFAAQSHVDNSIKNPSYTVINNILGTQNLLECARKSKSKITFLNVSTDEVYGDEIPNTDENSQFRPSNPYSASKASAEMLAYSYWKTYKLPVIITRANNIYGTHQYPEKVIPKFVFRLNKGMGCCLHGGGLAKRSFLHVEDACRAFDTILQKGKIGESYNIGSDEEIRIVDCAEIILSAVNNKRPGLNLEVEKDIFKVEDRAYNDKQYSINDDKLRKLGWKPMMKFSSSIQSIVDWFIDNENHWGSIDEILLPHPPQENIEKHSKLFEKIQACLYDEK